MASYSFDFFCLKGTGKSLSTCHARFITSNLDDFRMSAEGTITALTAHKTMAACTDQCRGGAALPEPTPQGFTLLLLRALKTMACGLVPDHFTQQKVYHFLLAVPHITRVCLIEVHDAIGRKRSSAMLATMSPIHGKCASKLPMAASSAIPLVAASTQLYAHVQPLEPPRLWIRDPQAASHFLADLQRCQRLHGLHRCVGQTLTLIGTKGGQRTARGSTAPNCNVKTCFIIIIISIVSLQ